MDLNNILKNGLVNCAVNANAGKLFPIAFDYDCSKGVALMNPSIFNDSGVIRVCVRTTNYILHHSESNKYPHWAGPLQYIHPEDDVRLATENYIVDLDNDLEVTKVRFVTMMESEHLWDFHGLEDARLIRWDSKLFLAGVRRDTTDNGQGRMELSEILLMDDSAVECDRIRIPAGGDDSSYCEKNWMPVLDSPYTFVKWSNPLDLVKYDVDNNTTTTILDNFQTSNLQVRGGSHVVTYGNYKLAIGHIVDLWKPYSGEKDSTYKSHLIVWDSKWNLLGISKGFSFLNARIEFVCGMCLDNDNNLLISFSYSDNIPFIFRVKVDWLIEYLIGGTDHVE